MAKEGLHGGNVELRVRPNPFRSIVGIHVRRQRTEDRGQAAEINILNVSGKVVYQLTADLCHLTSGISWNASCQPAGIYLVKVRAGNKIFTKKIHLLK